MSVCLQMHPKLPEVTTLSARFKRIEARTASAGIPILKSTAKAVLFQGGMLEMQHFCSHRAAVAAKYFRLPEFN